VNNTVASTIRLFSESASSNLERIISFAASLFRNIISRTCLARLDTVCDIDFGAELALLKSLLGDRQVTYAATTNDMLLGKSNSLADIATNVFTVRFMSETSLYRSSF